MFRAALLLAALFASTGAFAQVKCNDGLEPIERDAGSRLTAMDFIRHIAANELVFNRAFADFGYVLKVDLQTLTDARVDGQFKEVTKVAFDDKGVRRVTTEGGTVDTLKRVKLPHRDVDSLRDAFAITPEVLADRDIVYSGRQKIDDFKAAVFDILPRNAQSGARGFTGRTWVRGRDNAIVRICGRVTNGPFGPMRYLVQRTRVEDKYWFPAAINADETLRADDSDVHLRVGAEYSDYKARP